MCIEYRKQCEANACDMGRRRNTSGMLSNISVVPAVLVMMEIVKFANAGETCFQHLDIELAGHRLDLIGAEAQCEAIHEIPPAPEIIATRPRHFGEPGHGTLEGVAMDIGYSWHDDGVALVAR